MKLLCVARKFCIILHALLLVVAMSGALELNCFTQVNHWTNLGSIDECIFGNVVVSLPQEPITSVSMEQSGYDYDDVSEQTTLATADAETKNKILSFYILSSPLCFYVPSGIAENFKNIKVLIIANTGFEGYHAGRLEAAQKA